MISFRSCTAKFDVNTFGQQVEHQFLLALHAQSSGVDHQCMVGDGGIAVFPGHQRQARQVSDELLGTGGRAVGDRDPDALGEQSRGDRPGPAARAQK